MEKNNFNWRDILFAVVIILGALKLSHGLEQILDVSRVYESMFLGLGLKLAAGGGMHNPEMSPLYVTHYALLSLLSGDVLETFYLNQRFFTVLSPLVFYLLLRCFGVSRAASFCLTFFFLVSFGNMKTTGKPGHYAYIIMTIALIAADRFKPYLYSLPILALGAFASSFARPEFFLSFLIFSAATTVYAALHIRRGGRGRELAAAAVVAAIAVVVVTGFGTPLSGTEGRSRSWVAFYEHFSINYVEWNDLPVESPMEQGNKYAVRVFGSDVDSVKGAMLANPPVFFKHIATNAVNYVRNLFAVSFGHFNLLLPHTAKKWSIVESLILFAAASPLYLAALWRRRERVVPNIKEHWLTIAAILVISASTAGGAIVIYPRQYTLVSQCAFTVLAFMLAVKGGAVKRRSLTFIVLSSILFLTAVPSVGDGWYFKKSTAPLANSKTISFIRALNVAPGTPVLSSEGAISIYSGDNLVCVPSWTKTEPFFSFIKKHDVGLVISSKTLREDPSYSSDSQWRRFLDDYGDYGFIRMEVPGTERTLYVSKKALDAAAMPYRLKDGDLPNLCPHTPMHLRPGSNNKGGDHKVAP